MEHVISLFHLIVISLEHHRCSNGKVLLVVFQLLSRVWLFATLWTAACQVSLSFTTSQSLIKLMSIDILLKYHLLSLVNVLILSPSMVNAVMYPVHGFHIRKDFLPLVLGVLSANSLQLSDPSGFALSAEICFTQEAPPHPVMDQCEYKGLDNSAQLRTAVKGHSSTRDPHSSARPVTGPASQTFLSTILLPSPPILQKVLTVRALFNDTLLTKLHLRICFPRNLL